MDHFLPFIRILNLFITFRYLGDENGLLSVLKYDVDDGKLQKMPYNVSIHSLAGILLFHVSSSTDINYPILIFFCLCI